MLQTCFLHALTVDSKNMQTSIQWRHNERKGHSNHRRIHCLINCWFRRRSKETSKLRVTGLCAGNSPVTGEFPAQRASNAENVFIWWRHHDATRTEVNTLFSKLPGDMGTQKKNPTAKIFQKCVPHLKISVVNVVTNTKRWLCRAIHINTARN